MGQGWTSARQPHGRMPAQDRVIAVVQENAASLLRLARSHSLCVDDAQDAYQRALELYLERIDSVEAASAGSWLRTVVKHEAIRIRSNRQRVVPGEDVDFDEYVSPEAADGEERIESFERVARAADALRSCKRDEVTALFLRADGSTYAEIGSLMGWSYTKVNRCVTEGRARFLRRFAEIDRGDACDQWLPYLSAVVDGEATAHDMAEIRPHLRHCASCRATLRELYDSAPAVRLLLPAGLVFGTPEVADPGLLGRLYETLAGTIGDRLTAGALKAQAVIDAMGAGKVAAVAASAAAVAGGGAVAVEQGVLETGPQPRLEARAHPSPKRTQVVRAARLTPAPTATAVPTTEPGEARSPQRPRPPDRPRRKREPEFGFEAPAAPTAQPDAAAGGQTVKPAATPSGAGGDQEFGFEE